MTVERPKAAKTSRLAIAAILLLSLLWAADILRPDLLPGLSANQLPSLQRQAVSFLIFTLTAGILAWRKRAKPQSALIAKSAIVAIGMFSLPALLFQATASWLDGFGRLTLLTLTPLFALVFEPYLGGEAASSVSNQSGGLQSSSRLAAALAPVAGASLVFPVSVPSSLPAGAALAGIIVAAVSIAASNCIAVRPVFSEEQMPSEATPHIAQFAAYTGAIATIVFALLSAVIERPVWNWQRWQPELLWSVCIEVPGLFLLFWLMQRTTAVLMATRYVLSPLIAVVAGAIFVRPTIELRMALGLLLMVFGAGWLLFASETTNESQGLSLR